MQRKFPLALLFCFLGGFVSAQPAASDFRITRISRDLLTSPQYNYSGAENLHESHERWIKVDVQFSAFADFTDEVTFKYFVLLGGKVLTGEVTHVNVRPGKELYSCIYLPPHSIARILGNRPPSANSVENVAVQIVAKGEVKDEFSLARAAAQWYASAPAVTGLLLNKNETPFAPLFWDRYEQIKPAGR